MNPRDQDFGGTNQGKLPKMITSTSRNWSSAFKNPRIVRVSRAFGGKDRHSKVCTVRGLRDRRIRLSVPTAIQLYDLQFKLGLSQPSKVIDWLIDQTQDEIDKLPPLPTIPSPSSHFLPTPNEAYAKRDEREDGEGFGGLVGQLSAHNFFPMSSQFFAPDMPYSSNFFHWDNPSVSLSQFGEGFSFANQMEEQPHSSLSSSLRSSSQLYLCPSAASVPSITPHFPPSVPTAMEIDHLRLINHMQNVQQTSILPTALHLISSPMKTFGLSVSPTVIFPPENGDGKQEKDKRSC